MQGICIFVEKRMYYKIPKDTTRLIARDAQDFLRSFMEECNDLIPSGLGEELFVLIQNIQYKICKRLPKEFPSLEVMLNGKYDTKISSYVSGDIDDHFSIFFGELESKLSTTYTIVGLFLLWGEEEFRRFLKELSVDPDTIMPLINEGDFNGAYNSIIDSISEDGVGKWNNFLEFCRYFNSYLSTCIHSWFDYGLTIADFELNKARQLNNNLHLCNFRIAERIVQKYNNEYQEWKFLSIGKSREFEDLNEIRRGFLSVDSEYSMNQKMAQGLFCHYYTIYEHPEIQYEYFQYLFNLNRKIFYKTCINNPNCREIMEHYQNFYGDRTVFDISAFVNRKLEKKFTDEVDRFSWDKLIAGELEKDNNKLYIELQQLYRALVKSGYISNSREAVFVYRFSGLYYLQIDFKEKINWARDEKELHYLLYSMCLSKGKFTKMCDIFTIDNKTVSYDKNYPYHNANRIAKDKQVEIDLILKTFWPVKLYKEMKKNNRS